MCSEEERRYYDDLLTLKIDIKRCCTIILEYIQTGKRSMIREGSPGK